MFPHLKRLEVLAGPPYLAEIEVVVAKCLVALGKVRVKLDGSLIVGQGCGMAFL
jgi:hypothetical protein